MILHGKLVFDTFFQTDCTRNLLKENIPLYDDSEGKGDIIILEVFLNFMIVVFLINGFIRNPLHIFLVFALLVFGVPIATFYYLESKRPKNGEDDMHEISIVKKDKKDVDIKVVSHVDYSNNFKTLSKKEKQEILDMFDKESIKYTYNGKDIVE